MHLRVQACAALLALVVVAETALPTLAAGTDYDIADGHYYEQGTGTKGRGFVVVDDEAAPLWGELRRLGGVPAMGYPISSRYACDGGVCQAFQYAVFKWGPTAKKEVELLPVFDWLHAEGHDAWLDEVWEVPPMEPAAADTKRSTTNKDRVDDRDPAALLEANPAIKSAYAKLGGAASSIYGLPRVYRASEKQAVLRTQRTALVHSASAPDGVRRIPAGEVFREAGYVPIEALDPVRGPRLSKALPPVRISIPDLKVDADVIALDMGPDGVLPTPDTGRVVAWYSYGARLGEPGNAVLAGHVDWDRERGVFWALRDAKAGQVISLRDANGKTYDYKVRWVEDFPVDSIDGLEALRPQRKEARLTLVTCSGRFDFATRSYESRRVVRAALIGERP